MMAEEEKPNLPIPEAPSSLPAPITEAPSVGNAEGKADVVDLDIDEDRLMAALSYIGILVLVPLLIRKDRPFVYWHAKQGLVLLIGIVIAGIAVLWAETVGGMLLLVLLLLDVVGLVHALLGRKLKIPLIGQIADSFNI